MDSNTTIRALAALAQEHRLAAFRLLVQAGEEGLPGGGHAVRQEGAAQRHHGDDVEPAAGEGAQFLRQALDVVQAGEEGLPAGAIAEAVGAPASSMSFHLAQLSHAGLIRRRRQSRSLIYSADYAAMGGLMAYLTENCCGGQSCAPAASCETPNDTERNAA